MTSSSSSTAVARRTPNARPAASRASIRRGVTLVRAQPTGTSSSSSTSSTMSPRRIAAVSSSSNGSSTSGCTTSRISAAGSPSATTMREMVVAIASGSAPNTSASAVPSGPWVICRSRVASVTPRRRASSW